MKDESRILQVVYNYNESDILCTNSHLCNKEGVQSTAYLHSVQCSLNNGYINYKRRHEHLLTHPIQNVENYIPFSEEHNFSNIPQPTALTHSFGKMSATFCSVESL